MASLYRSGLPGSRVSGKVASFTLEILRTAHKHYATENGHRLSRLKLALLVVTRVVLIRNGSAKKLVKQEAIINHQDARLRGDLAVVLLGVMLG
jgi:hypothetical protein